MSNVRVVDAPLQEIRAASTASGGTALNTIAALISLPIGADWISVTPRNFVGAAVARVAINPWLTIVRTADLLLSEGTDFSSEAQDGDTTVFSAFLDTLANGDAYYIGSWLPFRGVAVDVTTVNSVGAVTLLCEYWNGGTWVTLSATDGTISGGTTLAVDGNVTWTVPAAWAKSSLRSNIAVTASAATFDGWAVKTPYVADLYWTRWTVDVAITAGATFAQLRPLNRSTAYAELTLGQPFTESFPSPVGAGNSFSCVEALTDAGTANLIVNAATRFSAERGAF